MKHHTDPSEHPTSALPTAALTDTVSERYEMGAMRRNDIPIDAHSEWKPPDERDMLAILKASNIGRVEGLIPVRHQRMQASAFTFYRGAPAVMAYDLAHTPNSGLYVQLCGDCHISNFGLFASPERNLVFDLNDFDETLPGPFEWDVKRKAASIVIAAQNANLTKKDARCAVRTALSVYRQKIHEFASYSYLDTWYSQVQADVFLKMVKKKHYKKCRKQTASTPLVKIP